MRREEGRRRKAVSSVSRKGAVVAQIETSTATNQSPPPQAPERCGRAIDKAAAAQPAAGHRAGALQRLAALGELTSGISHDFRNLLAVIDSGLRLAERNSDEPERMRYYLAAAREGIARGVELTSQLLDFAKHHELETHAADVNEFLRQFEPLLRYGAGPRNRIVLELASDLPKCTIDPALFDAAVLNLVVNARDAMTDGGEIQIATARLVLAATSAASPPSGTYVRVRVKDGGQGMPPEVLRRVFEPFFTTKGDKGTGMGLSQVYAFIHQIGGYVDIASEEGIGTTVDLLFTSSVG